MLAGGLLATGEVTAESTFTDLDDPGEDGGGDCPPAALPSPVYEAVAFPSPADGSVLFACGGRTADSPAALSECSEYEGGSWSASSLSLQVKAKRRLCMILKHFLKMFASQEPRVRSNALNAGGVLVLVSGGYDGEESYLDSIEALEDDSFQAWGTTLPEAMAGHCLAMLDESTALLTGDGRKGIGRICFLRTIIFHTGGYNPSTSYRSASYILDLESEEFVPTASMGQARAYHVCGTVTVGGK